MKFALMALGAVFLLGIGAGGAYFFFDKPAEASVGPVDESKKAEKKVELDKEGNPIVQQAQFIQMDPMVLPVIDENGIDQVVSLVISLEVPDAETAVEVKRMGPKLKDAYIQDMYGSLSREVAMQNGVVQVGYIKDRLNRTTAKVMGDKKINDVLLQVVQQRPM